MSYLNLYQSLKDIFSTLDKKIPGSGLKFFQNKFYSEFNQAFEKSTYTSEDKTFKALLNFFLKNCPYADKYILRLSELPDESFPENNNFDYFILKPSNDTKTESVIILLHGLNERSWYKYLPWAFELCSQTNKAVILFPIAFHINRAPSEWSDPRLMKEVAKERIGMLPAIKFSSFANAALSTRLQFSPECFLTSGLQTYFDIIKLIKDIRAGRNKFLAESTSVDLFGYSIGAFLAEILLMSNPAGLFSDSKLFIFCGGSVMNQTVPVSKAIMDSEAADALNNFYIHKFDSVINQPEGVGSLIGKLEEKGTIFKSMLRLDKFSDLRNSLLNQLKDRIKVLGLLRDRVFPPEGLIKTFSQNNSIILQDFDYSYSHENPFPLHKLIDGQVTNAFNNVFRIAASFLS